MKQPVIHLIKAELTAQDLGFPVLTICKVSRTFVNKDLTHFIRRILKISDDNAQQELILLRLKKIILQTPREPDATQLEAEPAEFAQFFNEIQKEQEFFEPIKWIDAELDYLKNINELKESCNKSEDVQKKDLLDRQEMLQLFKFSKTTLNRRIAEGMPAIKVGAKIMFNRQRVNDWLNDLP